MKDEIKKIFPKEFYIKKDKKMYAEISLENLNKIADCITNLQERNKKAIEYVNTHKVSDTITFPLMKKEQERDVKNCFDYEFEQIYKKDLLNILGGDDNAINSK